MKINTPDKLHFLLAFVSYAIGLSYKKISKLLPMHSLIFPIWAFKDAPKVLITVYNNNFNSDLVLTASICLVYARLIASAFGNTVTGIFDYTIELLMAAVSLIKEPNNFDSMYLWSHLTIITQGYAVLPNFVSDEFLRITGFYFFLKHSRFVLTNRQSAFASLYHTFVALAELQLSLHGKMSEFNTTLLKMAHSAAFHHVHATTVSKILKLDIITEQPTPSNN